MKYENLMPHFRAFQLSLSGIYIFLTLYSQLYPGLPCGTFSYRFACQNVERTILYSGYVPCPPQSCWFKHPDWIRHLMETKNLTI